MLDSLSTKRVSIKDLGLEVTQDKPVLDFPGGVITRKDIALLETNFKPHKKEVRFPDLVWASYAEKLRSLAIFLPEQVFSILPLEDPVPQASDSPEPLDFRTSFTKFIDRADEVSSKMPALVAGKLLYPDINQDFFRQHLPFGKSSNTLRQLRDLALDGSRPIRSWSDLSDFALNLKILYPEQTLESAFDPELLEAAQTYIHRQLQDKFIPLKTMNMLKVFAPSSFEQIPPLNAEFWKSRKYVFQRMKDKKDWTNVLIFGAQHRILAATSVVINQTGIHTNLEQPIHLDAGAPAIPTRRAF